MSLKSILKEEALDIILITPSGVFYYDLEIENKSLKIKKTNKIVAEIFKDEKIIKENLEEAIKTLKEKEKIEELGIILHLPSVFFQQVVLPRTGNPESAIRNYFQVNLPLPLEKYHLIFKENIYHLSGNLSNFDVFLFPKEIIEDVFEVINKFEITIYFIAPALESVLNNLIYQTIVGFNENYLVIFIDQEIIQVLFLENLKLEKYFVEKINPQTTNFNILIKRFINYFETQNKKFNILIFSEIDLNLENLKIIKTNVYDFIVQGGLILLKKIFNDQKFLDLFEMKPKSIYFLSRFQRTIIVATVFILSLIFISTSVFLGFYLKLNKELSLLKKETAKIQQASSQNLEENFNYLLNINKILNEKSLILDRLNEVFQKNLVYYDLEKKEAQFILNKEDFEKIKENLPKLGSNLKIKEENIDEKTIKVIINW